jgi:cysteinyl-tRNA synthetase
LHDADSALTRLYTALRGYPSSELETLEQTDFATQFDNAMNDDFNTPSALAVLFDLAREINRKKTEYPEIATTLAIQLRQLGDLLGILQQDADVFLKKQVPGVETTAKFYGGGEIRANTSFDQPDSKTLSDDEINQLIKQRTYARNNKNWELADEIRDDLLVQGIILEDVSGDTAWRRK